MITKADLGDGDQPLESLSFRCPLCRTRWEGPPDVIEDAPDLPHHPWRYFSDCPRCSQRRVPQCQSERALMRAWASDNKPGAKTDAGRRQCAINLRGDPEQPRRARFNALKHGAYARTATYFPSRPGEYPHCTGCPYLEDDCERGPEPCKRRTELFFRHHLAFDTADPEVLRPLNSDLQANVRALIDDMILALISDGVALRTPKVGQDKDGAWSTAYSTDPETGERRLVIEVNAHPLLRQLGDMLAKNKLSLGDMGMTPQAREDQDDALGRLANDERHQEAALEYQARQTEALEGLAALIERSREKSARDPILLEHRESDEDA